MISIRFFPELGRRGELVGLGPLAGASGGAEVGAEATILSLALAADCVVSIAGRLVANYLSVLHLTHASVVDQQVEVADHLREGEERLGDRDVAPQRLCQVIARPRLLGDQAVELLGPSFVQGKAVGDRT